MIVEDVCDVEESFVERVPIIQEEYTVDNNDIIEVKHLEFFIVKICFNSVYKQINFHCSLHQS